MTLPLSGQISMSQVDSELSRATNAEVSLGETAVRNLAGVVSGQISLASLYGKALVTLPATITLDDTKTAPANPSAGITLLSNGTFTTSGLDSSPTGGTWNSAGNGSAYWCKLVVNSGTNPTSGSGANTLLQLSANRSWTWTRTGPGTTSANCTLSIYSDSGGTQLVASSTLSVNVFRDIA